MTVNELQAVSGFALGVASAAIMLALVYVRRALQSQREARALLEGAWAAYLEVAARQALADVWLVVTEPGGLFGAWLDEGHARRAAEAVGGVLVGLRGEAILPTGCGPESVG